MISQVVDPPEKLRDVAQALAEKIAKNSPAAMRATKRALWGALEYGLDRRLPGGCQAPDVDVGTPRSERGTAGVRRQADAELASAGAGFVSLVDLLDGLPDVAVHTPGSDVSRDELTDQRRTLGATLTELGLTPAKWSRPCCPTTPPPWPRCSAPGAPGVSTHRSTPVPRTPNL